MQFVEGNHKNDTQGNNNETYTHSGIKEFVYNQEFLLECGESLKGFTLAYQTFGNRNADDSNVVWIVHALTANSNPMEWWPGVVGTGKAIDPNKHFIICANCLGSPYGSTNPLSINPESGENYYHRFPMLTNRDIANSFELLRIHLDINCIHLLVGASLGGQQAMEWSLIVPKAISNLILIATNAKHSSWGIAFNESQRLAIEADQTWQESTPTAGLFGLLAARSIALLSYRTATGYNKTQLETNNNKIDGFKVSTYQKYQGQKLINRFNAFSYWTLTKAMDSHNVGRNRISIENALGRILAKTIIIGIDTDILFPLEEQKFLYKHISNARFEILHSELGHDGFLTENLKISAIIANTLK